MSRTAFWTQKRLEALSKTSLTLFQGFVLAGALGGVFGKIAAFWMKALFVGVTVSLFVVGIVFADWSTLRSEPSSGRS